MKNSILIISIMVSLMACKNNPENQEISVEEVIQETTYAAFGMEISETDALTKEEMALLFKDLKPGDTVSVKFKSLVNEVCQSKGCWMKLDLGNEEAMVKFKDYGFFMPKNIAGEEVIVSGIAYVDEMSVEEQRHYAEDAGKQEEEIAEIITSKKTLSFEANGVLLIE